MSIQIDKRFNGFTLWRGEDPEGKTTYDVTTDREGVAVEPVRCNFYSKKAALESYKAK